MYYKDIQAEISALMVFVYGSTLYIAYIVVFMVYFSTNMIPDGYKSPTGKKGSDPMEYEKIIGEIRSIRQELAEDMKALGLKLDTISAGHNDLRIEFVRSTTQIQTRLEKSEKDISALWDHSREIREKVAGCTSAMETHKAESSAVEKKSKSVADWVKWIPGIVFGLIATVIAIFGRL